MREPDSHLHPAAKPAAYDVDWDTWSQAWTRQMPLLAGRTDLTVVVAPGAGGGNPACFYPDRGRIEIDAAHIGTPQVADPRRATHKKLVPTAYGLLIHEAGHAAHTRWRTPRNTPPVVAAAADLLEESRAEGRQRSRRRGNRRWLRHAVNSLLRVEDAPVDDAWHAGKVAALLLARVDARILTYKDTRTARAAVISVLGRRRLRALREIWRQAHAVADTDGTAIIDLAWQWCQVLGIDPAHQSRLPTPDLGEFAGLLAAALADYLAAAAGATTAEYLASQIAAAYPVPASWTRRDPTDAERAAARYLARQLREARAHPTPASMPAVLPPGRLQTRQAITADAQLAAGAIPTAAPWRARTNTPPPKPALRLAVLVDVSGSMRAYAAPLSSAAWILAHGAHRNQAATATIAFGSATTLLIPPRERPIQVLEMATRGGTTTFTDAVKLADQLLDLRSTRNLNLLAVVSDGALNDREPSQKLITTLHRSGCAVLWLRPSDLPGHTFDHTTTITVTDPVDAITHITNAALTALVRA
jgi:hypothetical protein